MRLLGSTDEFDDVVVSVVVTVGVGEAWVRIGSVLVFSEREAEDISAEVALRRG